MSGEKIIVRTLTLASPKGKSGNHQYHSRSDHHSKVACWAIVFDLLSSCPTLLNHVVSKKVFIGINHKINDFTNGKSKNLDLVICTPGSKKPFKDDFHGMEAKYSIQLSPSEQAQLKSLPQLERREVGSVLVALEAKACMTAHQKSWPRLYDELNSSHAIVHGASDDSIAAGYVLVNASSTHASTVAPYNVNKHRQPDDALGTIDVVKQLRRRSGTGQSGYDALGISVIDLANNGSPVLLVPPPTGLIASDPLSYDQMIQRICSAYSARFRNI